VQMRDPPTVYGFCQDQTSSADRATGAALQSEGRDRCTAKFLNNNLLGLQVHEWRCGLSGGRSERPENRIPGSVGLQSPGGSANPILLRKEYGCVVAEPGAETWPIQVIEVLYEPREEFRYRGRCGVQIHSSLVAAVSALAGFVKGAVGPGLPTGAMAVLAIVMPPGRGGGRYQV
jgi:hypothetical protein